MPLESVVVLPLPVPDSVMVTPETHDPVTVPEIVQFVVQLTANTVSVKD